MAADALLGSPGLSASDSEVSKMSCAADSFNLIALLKLPTPCNSIKSAQISRHLRST